MTRGDRPSMIATHEFVVPRSIPIISPAALLLLRLRDTIDVPGAVAAAARDLSGAEITPEVAGQRTLASCR